MAGERIGASGAGPNVGHEARAGSRGAASGVNLEQNRAIGQDDPMVDHRPGSLAQRERARHPGAGEPGDGEGTDASQRREAGET